MELQMALPVVDSEEPQRSASAPVPSGPIAEFVIPGEPKGKGRHRSRIAKTSAGKQFVHSYAPKDTVEYENLVRMAAHDAMAGRDPQAGPVSVRLTVVCSVPRSWSKKRQARALAGGIRPTGKPDLDNVEKAVLDGLNKIVVRDDAQVCEVAKGKRYGAAPHVAVVVLAIDAEAA